MHAYRNIKLTTCPDVGDIRSEGRRSAIGRIPRGETHCPRYENGIVQHADGRPGRDLNAGKIIHNDRGYCRSVAKAVVRRALKKADRRLTDLEVETHETYRNEDQTRIARPKLAESAMTAQGDLQ